MGLSKKNDDVTGKPDEPRDGWRERERQRQREGWPEHHDLFHDFRASRIERERRGGDGEGERERRRETKRKKIQTETP